MTLDPVQFDGIAALAERIRPATDERDHRDYAATVWDSFLDPLYDDRGRVVLEPIDGLERRSVDVQDVALRESSFETSHGLDAGTINPTTYKNGLVVDAAHAAMSATPSDADLHRARTVVAAVHTNDAAAAVDEGWSTFDDGYGRSHVRLAPRTSRFEEAVVHALSLYLAESTHAREHIDAVSDLLVLDGPIYPKGLLQWVDRHPALADLLEEAAPREVLQGYLDLVGAVADRDLVACGFVKNVSTKVLTRTLREKEGGSAPWVDDRAFFRQVLARREDGEVATDRLTYTNWFRSFGGTDRVVAERSLGLERDRPDDDYAVTFCVLYDPRTDTVYRLEAPAVVTRDADTRRALTRHVLGEVAARRGPPAAVAKADDLARISREEKESLRRAFEVGFDTERDRTYDDERWGDLA